MTSDPREALILDLFEQHYDRVYTFLRRSVDAATAEDVTQDVFTRLLDVPDLETRELSVSYLFKIADNLIKRRYRRARKLEAILEHTRESMGKPGRDASDRGRVPWEAKSIPARELGILKGCERDVLELVVCRGLSYQQAASSLGVRITDVNNWKHRGIQRLKQHAVDRDERQRAPTRRGGGFGQRAG